MPAQPSPRARKPGWRAWLLLFGVAALTIALDQATKAYVAAHLALHESWMPLRVVEPYFRFTHVHNTGAAFGVFPQGGSIFLVIAVVVSLVIVYYYRQMPDGSLLVRLALGLQMGGALGNVIDRVRLGYVVDFLNVRFWPVFNVADSAIVLGVVLLVLEMLRDEYQLARERKRAADGDADQKTELPGERVSLR